MTGWIVLGAVLAALLLIGLTPVGARAAYQEKKLTVELTVGPLRIPLYPPKEKKRKREEPPGGEKGGQGKPEKPEKKRKALPAPNWEQIRYTLDVLPPVLRRALGRTRRRVRIEPLHLLAVFGGEDPADTASLYYHGEALRGTVLPALRRLVRVRDEAVTLGADYDREDTYIKGELGLRIRVGDVVLIALSAAAGLVRWFIGFRRRASAPRAEKVEKGEGPSDREAAAA